MSGSAMSGRSARVSGQPVQGRGLAWAAFVLGAVMSVAANVVRATYHPTFAVASGPDVGRHVAWSPTPGAMVAAAFWPLALLLAAELVTRVRWPEGLGYALVRYAGLGLVAVGAGVISYRHLAELLSIWGYDVVSAHIGPLVIDGLMLVAGLAVLAVEQTRRETQHVASARATRQARRGDMSPAVVVSGRRGEPTRRRRLAAIDPTSNPTSLSGEATSGEAGDPTLDAVSGPVSMSVSAGDMSLGRGQAAGRRAVLSDEAREDLVRRLQGGEHLREEDPLTGASWARQVGLSERQGQRIVSQECQDRGLPEPRRPSRGRVARREVEPSRHPVAV
jgi:hypothetical protein